MRSQIKIYISSTLKRNITIEMWNYLTLKLTNFLPIVGFWVLYEALFLTKNFFLWKKYPMVGTVVYLAHSKEGKASYGTIDASEVCYSFLFAIFTIL